MKITILCKDSYKIEFHKKLCRAGASQFGKNIKRLKSQLYKSSPSGYLRAGDAKHKAHAPLRLKTMPVRAIRQFRWSRETPPGSPVAYGGKPS
ncbi:hypothetical protein NUACC26_032510 [Scytonema sp. NUACC26]